MPNLNKVMIMGNLTRDPELKHLGDNSVVNITIATNRVYYVDDEKREETTYVDLEAWGKKAETLHKYLSKGKPLFVEGRLKLDKWEDQDGNPRSKLKVVVEGFQFLGGKRQDQPKQERELKQEEIPF